MKDSNIVSSVTELPVSCKSAMEKMELELEREEAQDSYQIANLSEKGVKKLGEFEDKLKSMGCGEISLVAYSYCSRRDQ